MHDIQARIAFKDELEHFKNNQLFVPLGVAETLERCNSFVLVPNHNGKVWLYFDITRLN